jgi:hypothetical protein
MNLSLAQTLNGWRDCFFFPSLSSGGQCSRVISDIRYRCMNDSCVFILQRSARNKLQLSYMMWGKTVSDLGWFMRVVATIVGPRGVAFAMYHDHEKLGAQMLQGKSEQRTIDLVGGTADDVVMTALRDADSI